MPTQKLGTFLITRVCFHTPAKALATLFGACPNPLSKWSVISSTTAQALFLTRNTLFAFKSPPAFNVHFVSKKVVLSDARSGSIFCQGVAKWLVGSATWTANAAHDLTGKFIGIWPHTSILGTITEHYNVARRLIMKAISKDSLAGCLVHLDAGSTTLWPQKPSNSWAC